MNEIAITMKNEPRVDSRLLADHLQLQHESLAKLLRDYRGDFEQLGKVRFEIGPSEGSRTGQKVKFAMLNEDQCYLLLAYSRNTARVRELKVKLVQAFAEARKARDLTQTEYLPAYHQLHETIHRLADGSPNERFVHMNVNKAINKAVGIEAGQRNVLDFPAKSLVTVAQMVAARAMGGATDHHDGYEACKQSLAVLNQAITAPCKKLPKAA